MNKLADRSRDDFIVLLESCLLCIFVSVGSSVVLRARIKAIGTCSSLSALYSSVVLPMGRKEVRMIKIMLFICEILALNITGKKLLKNVFSTSFDSTSFFILNGMPSFEYGINVTRHCIMVAIRNAGPII